MVDNSYFFYIHLQTTGHQAQFWFATGGAGFCISYKLALKMAPVIRNDKLMTISDRIGFPDDVTIGFIIGKFCFKQKTQRTHNLFNNFYFQSIC